MTQLIQCPRCQAKLDASNVAAGATIRCKGCQSLVRVPTGSHPQVDSATRPPQRQTAIFRKMAQARVPGSTERPPRGTGVYDRGAARRTNQTALILGCSVGGLALLAIVVVIVATQSNKKRGPEKTTARNEAATPNRYEEREPEQPAVKAEEKSGSVKKSEGTFQPPAAFTPGAEGVARRIETEFHEVKVDASLLSAFDELAKKGDATTALKEDFKWTPCIIRRLLSDDETIASYAFRALFEICKKHDVKTDKGENPIQLSFLNSPEYRGGDYVTWAKWWNTPKNQVAVASWNDGPGGVVEYAPIDAETADWDKILQGLRGGGAFELADTPEGAAVQRIRAMGKKGLEKLIGFLNHEELTMIRAIVATLNFLTGEKKPLPTPANRDQAKTEWEYWLKTH